ncbi:hypothetical protein X907_2202 [Glycocaulis alkaliphilus]|uniref:Uncharacterized protein n=1 Tax=Glycocaulis alkaliphilus TaxID=1434191 RepID=A0A3T0EBW4_9PROT|nr:hypothetical protein X907_2202 [Glycocaulis alkaliphilus]
MVSQPRPAPAGKLRKREKQVRPPKRQRLFQLTILDLTWASPAPKSWPAPVRSKARASSGARTPFRTGGRKTGQPYTQGD